MKKFIYYTLFQIITTTTFSQVNLVPNPSFEDLDECPTQFNQLTCLNNWSYPVWGLGRFGFNSCTSDWQYSTPSNLEGYQNPLTGDGYGFICIWGINGLGNSMFQNELDSTLDAGVTYYAEFYLSLADSQYNACNNVGMYFSSNAVTTINGLPYNVTPQISNDPIQNPLTSKTNWMKVSGYFTAQGGEKFITIGNFIPDELSDTTFVPGGCCWGAGYYFDDVLVRRATPGEGVGEYGNGMEVKVFPNPTINNLTINISAGSITNEVGIKEVKIYNVLGEEVISQKFESQNSKEQTINVSALPQGMYILEANTGKGVIRKKIVKQ